MDRFDVIKFEDLTGPKGGDWVRIGGGSFGVVFRVSSHVLIKRKRSDSLQGRVSRN